MDSPEKYKSNLTFIDLLFNILVGFVFLFIIAFILINPKAKQGDIKSPAEFLITLEWPPNLNEDLDLWVQSPDNHKVGFRMKDAGIMNLDRDDLGIDNDTTVIDGKMIVVPINREVISVRGKLPGIYHVNVHYYRKLKDITIPATISVIKVNPYIVVYTQTLEFTVEGQIKSYHSFLVDDNGYVPRIHEISNNIVPISHHEAAP